MAWPYTSCMHLVSFWPLKLIMRIHLWWAQVLGLERFKKQFWAFYPPCEVKCRLQNGVSTPWFLNMVMTFVLTSRPHNNTITEPRAHFLLSLLEGISINFPLHMIKSIIDCYRDTATHDKLIFLLAIMYLYPYAHHHPSFSSFLCHGCH